MGIRVTNYRKKMNVISWAIAAAFVTFLVAGYVLDEESTARSVIGWTSVAVLFAGILVANIIGCANCGAGWHRSPSGSIRRELERRRQGLSNVRFDPNDVPERCPVCDAEL